MRETLDGFQSGLQIGLGGRTVTNLRYADDIVLLATSEAELQTKMSSLTIAQSLTFLSYLK